MSDIENLDPLNPEIMKNQATINIGTIGHVAHGKSTLVKAISGVQTVRFRSEKERNITIRLGYANAKIYKCDNPDCPPPGCYGYYGSNAGDGLICKIAGCGGNMILQRHISFVDCPGHDVYMATMLSGASVMDAALLLVAGNESCPQPQTGEHLAAVEIMDISKVIVLQNKMDLVKKENALDHRNSVRKFVRGTKADDSPIIPISAVLGYNIDGVCQAIVESIPVPVRDFKSDPRMIIIRSFDINKPGCTIDNLQGGVVGGAIMKGVLRVGEKIEIRPGVASKDPNGKTISISITTTIVSMQTEENQLKFAIPGGLIGVGTLADPSLTRADRIVGQVVGRPGHMPSVFLEVIAEVTLLVRLLGTKREEGSKQPKVQKLMLNEILLLNIAASSASGTVVSISSDKVKFSLTKPVCAEVGYKISLSRRFDGHFRLIGWGTITKGFA